MTALTTTGCAFVATFLTTALLCARGFFVFFGDNATRGRDHPKAETAWTKDNMIDDDDDDDAK